MNKKHIIKSLIIAAFLLILPLGLVQQTVFAGDPNCQSGYIHNPYNNYPPPRLSENEYREERRLAAAQIRNTGDQSPPNGITGNDSPTRSDFSYFSSILIVFGGLWALFVLLRQRFGRRRQIRTESHGLTAFIFRPSFALSMFGLLFAGAIAVSVLTKPSAVGAEKRARSKSLMTGVFNPSNKPVFKSAQQIGGDESTQIGAPVFDAEGNRYVRGTFTRSLPIGEQTLQESKFFDMFVAKYAPDGTALWARQGIGATTEINVPGTAVEGATALTVDGDGNVYVGGSFVKKLTLQGSTPGQNITLRDDTLAGVNYESFVAKYDADGNLLWARGGNSGSPKNADNLEIGQNAIGQIVLDSSGNPYITGFISGSRFFGTAAVNNGKTDILLAKLDAANGAVIWKHIIGGAEDENGLDLKIDSANNLYMIGNFASPEIIFPNGATFGNLNNLNGSEKESTNAFIAKFTGDGNTLWVKNLDNENTLGGSQIAVNAAGEIFLTGYYFDTAIFGKTVLTEGEGSGEDEDALGGYVTKLDTDGDFLWAEGFGGIGKAISLDAAGRVYVVGTFWDGGTFGAATANEDVLASFGGVDLFVARYDAGGGFDWAKPIAGSDFEGGIDIGNPSDENGTTDNNYSPLGIAYNPATQTMFVSGDFRGTLSLDCQTLRTPNERSRHSYLAELSADGEQTSCRIWNGLDEDDNNFDSPDNWNGGVIPGNNDSIYVPYTGNSFDNPTYNPQGIGIIVNNLTVSDDRTLTVERDLPITGKLWLLGGFININSDRIIDLTDTATADRIADADGNGGYVIGKIRKDFGTSLAPFIFPVGTANGYSPVDVDPQAGIGALLAIKAVEQPQPLFANTPNRINRYWSIDRAGKGFIEANLTFHYLQTDVVGNESQLNLFKIEDDTPFEQTAVIDTTENTATVNNISEFSDWTLASLAPTAATATVGGRVLTANGRGIPQARVTLTDSAGIERRVITNSFGYYRFTDVVAGATYIFSVKQKDRESSPVTQVQTVLQDIDDLDFIVTASRTSSR